MQLQLTTTFKGDKLVSSPSKVEVTVFSFSKKPQFKSGGDRVVMITADGEEIKLGTLNSTVFEGETKNGIDSFYPADNPNLGMRVPVPQSAQIRSSGDLNGTSMELMLLSVKSEQFLKIAKAATLEMRIGTIALALNDRHREIIRNFADSITPR